MKRKVLAITMALMLSVQYLFNMSVYAEETSTEQEEYIYQNSLVCVLGEDQISYKVIRVLNGVKKVYIPDKIKNLPVEDVDLDVILDVPSCEQYVVSGAQTNLSAKDGVLYSKDGSTLIRYPESKLDTSFTVPSTATKIKEGAFKGNGFLSTIIVGDSVKTIEKEAFLGCKSLETIEFGTGVKTFGKDALGDCMKLSKITVKSSNKYFTTVDDILYNKNKTTLVRYPVRKIGASFEIPSSVKEIGAFAFKNVLNLEKIKINQGVKKIQEGAFFLCLFVDEISLPTSLEFIGESAFAECNSLKKIEMKKNKNFIFEDGGLYDAAKKVLYLVLANNGVKELVLPKTLKEIKSYAMYRHRSIEKVVLGPKVEKMGDYIFGYVHTLEQVEIPRSVKSIGDDAFYDCFSEILGYYDSEAYKFARAHDIDFVAKSTKLKAPKVTLKKIGKNKYTAKWKKISNAYYQVKVNNKIVKKNKLNLSSYTFKAKGKKKPVVKVSFYKEYEGIKCYSA